MLCEKGKDEFNENIVWKDSMLDSD
jgi:hypothetical protein